jgi:hypothetical protein
VKKGESEDDFKSKKDRDANKSIKNLGLRRAVKF